MKYHYFVSFATTDGFGNAEHITLTPIQTIKDVTSISRGLEKELDYEEETIVIINYQLFR